MNELLHGNAVPILSPSAASIVQIDQRELRETLPNHLDFRRLGLTVKGSDSPSCYLVPDRGQDVIIEAWTPVPAPPHD